MPSLTPIVLNRIPTMPAAATPFLACAPSLSRCMLQVLPSYHMAAMPTCGFCMSASVMPVPYSMACEAPWLLGCVMREVNLLSMVDRFRSRNGSVIAIDRRSNEHRR